MRPSVAGEFSHAEVFDMLEASAEEAHALRDFAAGFVESMARVLVEGGIDGESEKAVGLSRLGSDRELADLDIGTMSARPLFARQGDPDGTCELGRVCLHGLSMGTSL